MTRRMAVVLVVPVLVVLVLGVYAAPGTTSAGLVGRLNSEVMLPGDQALRLVLSDIKAGRLDETRYQHLATIGEVDAAAWALLPEARAAWFQTERRSDFAVYRGTCHVVEGTGCIWMFLKTGENAYLSQATAYIQAATLAVAAANLYRTEGK